MVWMIDELMGWGINPPPTPRDGTSADTTTRRRASSHTCALGSEPPCRNSIEGAVSRARFGRGEGAPCS